MIAYILIIRKKDLPQLISSLYRLLRPAILRTVGDARLKRSPALPLSTPSPQCQILYSFRVQILRVGNHASI